MPAFKRCFSLRVDSDLMEKFIVMAKENSRSVNKEMEYIMVNALKQYEKEHGVIQVDKSQK